MSGPVVSGSASWLGFWPQVGAEVRSRLRSPATLVALGVILLGAFFWIPSPTGKAASITWRGSDGLVYAPEQSAAYLGVAMAMLSGIVLAIFGFYLVVGAIARDRRSGLGGLLAATPLSNLSYLAAKVVAHASYLGLLSLASLPVGIYQFLRFGRGDFEIVPFLAPLLLIVPPSILFVATMAVLFEVTPGLKGRVGWVVWFLTLGLWLGAIPLALSQRDSEGRLQRLPWFDPAGALALDVLIERSVDDIEPKSLSTGLIFHQTPPVRVPWRGFPITPSLVVARAANLVVCAALLALALLFFDRFDPARTRLSLRGAPRAGKGDPQGADPLSEVTAAVAASVAVTAAATKAPRSLHDLPTMTVRPSAWAAVLADAKLAWSGANWLRWPLVALSLAGAFAPTPAAGFLGVGFLLVLGLVISEAPARESLAGAGPLVFSQPSVPASPTLWKFASLAVFSFVLGAPLVVRSLTFGPARGVAFVSGLIALAGFAAAFGLLSGGGKLFSVLLLALLYGLLNGAPALDLCGVMGGALSLLARLSYLGAAVGFVALSMARERVTASR